MVIYKGLPWAFVPARLIIEALCQILALLLSNLRQAEAFRCNVNKSKEKQRLVACSANLSKRRQRRLDRGAAVTERVHVEDMGQGVCVPLHRLLCAWLDLHWRAESAAGPAR